MQKSDSKVILVLCKKKESNISAYKCIIEFMEHVAKWWKNAQKSSHFISFLQLV